jgi:hypothetical protein
MDRVKFNRVIERDVDLLLLEEFFSSPGFAEWFAKAIGLKAGMTLEQVRHSVNTPSGESDLELWLSCGGKVIAILIEDKIGAAFQPQQAERYRKRGESYVRRGKCGEYLTVLVAPTDYVSDSNEGCGFDKVVTYEEVAEWFDEFGPSGQRTEYKVHLLRTAIKKGVEGYVLVPDTNATRFWHRYWELTTMVAPELNMKEPGLKPATSSFIHFYPAGLPKGATLLHKVPYGHVDIQFAGHARRLKILENRYLRDLQPGMRISAAGKSGVIRVNVPKVDVAAPFEQIEGPLREGIWAARHLALWINSLRK